MMNQLIERFPAQLVEAMEIGENATILPYDQQIDLVRLNPLHRLSLFAGHRRERYDTTL